MGTGLLYGLVTLLLAFRDNGRGAAFTEELPLAGYIMGLGLAGGLVAGVGLFLLWRFGKTGAFKEAGTY